MKIYLINPATRVELNPKKERFFIKAGSRWPWSYERDKDEHFKTGGYPFPFYLAYSAQILKDNDFEVSVYDGVALNSSDQDFIDHSKKINPDIIVLETSMHAYKQDFELLDRLKKETSNEFILIVVGPQATGYATEILENYPIVDYAIKGEYEFALNNLISCIESKKIEDIKSIEGVCFKSANGIFIHDNKAYIQDINDLPMPLFKAFPREDKPDISIYGDGINTYKPAITLHSTRGCPYKCDFCLWVQVMYDNKKYRRFEPKRIVDEMEYVINEFGAKEIYFDEDNFCVNKKHVTALCQEIIDRNLKIKWSCMGDAMSCDKEMIEIMAKAGCIYMKFGVESGNKEILKNIGKPLDPEKAVKVSEWCWQNGIMTHATFMFGLTGETVETMNDTLKLANRIKFDYAQASIATPFPGTRFFDRLKEDGELITSASNDDFDGTKSYVVQTKNLTPDIVVNFRKKAIRSMVLHKLINLTWWSHALKHNFIKLRHYGLYRVMSPLRAYFNII